MKNIILFFPFLLLLNQFICVIIKAQNINPYDRIDTLKVCDSPGADRFIIYIKSDEIQRNEVELQVTDFEIHNFLDNSLVQIFSDTSNYGMMSGDIEYIDINLDGCKDIDIHTSGYNLTPTHTFLLFDKIKKEFHYSSNFGLLEDYSIEDNNEIISTELSVGGSGGYWQTYKVENDSLKLIRTESSNFYDYQKDELINGVFTTVKRIESHDENDKNGNTIKRLESYDLIYDSLRITEIKWMVETQKWNSELLKSDIYNCDWGLCLKYLRKVIYSYHKINNEISKDTYKYQVINDKWQLVIDFK